MHRVRMLMHFGVIPYMVFDGDYLPSKAATEVERAGKRAESKRIGLELYRLGKPSQAQSELQKAVDVTPEMARQLIEELKRHDVKYVVAPYEADAQLVYLERKSIIQGILSEDSDLLVFGAKRLLTKLDQYGDCIEINRNDFTACTEISLVGWSDAEFRQMAILSGCDYLANINNMGLKTAYRLVRKYKSVEKILKILQFDGKYRVPLGYLASFQRAELTFLHQRVFCPQEMKLVMATELGVGPEPEELAFIGKPVEADIAVGVANGDLHPMTKKPIIISAHTQKASNTPWPTPKRHSLGTPSDPKAGKSIESFFKSQRTPLAELDPNSFTPSPSQRRLLTQQNPTFLSTPDASAPFLHRSTASLPEPSRASISATSIRVEGITRTSASVPYPPKRQRLCEDDLAEDVMLPPCGRKLEAGRSRFFASNAPDPSPSVKRRGRNTKKTANINIWSDDSLDDVLLGLADVADNYSDTSKTGKITVYKDDADPGSKCVELTTPVDSQASTLSNAATQILDSVSSSMCSGSFTQRESQASSVSTVGSTLIEDDFLLGKYAYKPSPAAGLVGPHTARKVLDNKTLPSQNTTPKPRASRSGSMSTLQRLRQGALHRSRAYDIDPIPVTLSNEGRIVTRKPPGAKRNVPQSPEPPVYISLKGSEDLLVPNSEDEVDGHRSSDVEAPANPKLDLGRFTFSG
ncbi:Rad2 nuclease [Trapelia coarctata]|nr:Rad2 nuclease [Trapelia coarctata]